MYGMILSSRTSFVWGAAASLRRFNIFQRVLVGPVMDDVFRHEYVRVLDRVDREEIVLFRNFSHELAI